MEDSCLGKMEWEILTNIYYNHRDFLLLLINNFKFEQNNELKTLKFNLTSINLFDHTKSR